ncbi:MAG: toll/interleukin-1 receptor domain-containing protein, partial [Verrucomicrobiota bacterium]
MTSPSISSTRYWCFISYRHADNSNQDREWASWLHQEIERYDVPADLVGNTNRRGDIIPERIYPVFRDETSLPADASLATAIRDAMNRSHFMVVLCSPRAVESKYVTQEILHFKQSGKDDRIIAAILDGEPNGSLFEDKQSSNLECFPEPLLYSVSSDGQLDRSERIEPIAADFRLSNG